MSNWSQWTFANAALFASIGWFVCGDLALAYIAAYDCGKDYSGFNLGFLLTDYQGTLGLVGFAIGGMVTGYALKLAVPPMSWKHVIWVGLGWVVGPVIGLNLGLATGWAVGDTFADRPELFLLPNPQSFTRFGATFSICRRISQPIGLGLSFIIGGAVIGDTLRTLSTLTIYQKQVVWIAVGWAIGAGVGLAYILFLLFPTLVLIATITMDIAWAVGFGICLLASGYVVRRRWPEFSWRRAVFVAIKWIMGITLGVFIGLITNIAINFAYFGVSDYVFGWPDSAMIFISLIQFTQYGLIGIAWALGFAIAGAIGFSITLRCISRAPS